MPRDGKTFYLEDNTFVRQHDEGIKIYKTRDNKPDGPDSMQVTANRDEALKLVAFIVEQVEGPLVDPQPTVLGDGLVSVLEKHELAPLSSGKVISAAAKKNSGSGLKASSPKTKTKASATKGAALTTGATPVKTKGKATKKK